MSIKANIEQIKAELPTHVTLVVVSKTKPIHQVMEAYDAGCRIFGENKVQELTEKYETMPKDIEWHMIGHLQRNKVKYIAPFVSLIHGVDSEKLLAEIDKQAKKSNRVINCLLQLHIAKEETKFGFDFKEAQTLLESNWKTQYPNVHIEGLMGMATFTDNEGAIRNEFESLGDFYKQHPELSILSMGMSGDYHIAVESGSTMVRIGSTIFGARND